MRIFRSVCQFFKSLTVAFSIYSKIPVPRFTWGSDDMKYHLIFFPWVGAVIGGAEWGWFKLCCGVFASNHLFYIMIALALPLLITGGFHLDGFLDTMDALHSYGDRQKKLEILIDPHIGAFAVISFALYLLLAGAFLSLVNENSSCAVIASSFSFFISRCLSGISVLTFPKAKPDGMLAAESASKKPLFVIVILFIELAAGGGLLFYLTGLYAVFTLSAILLSFLYYYAMSRKNFGGITGDLAGFFVCLSELLSLLVFIFVR